MTSSTFPSVSQVHFQSFIGGLVGRAISDREVASFASKVREVQSKLTERAALVLFALSRAPGPITARSLPLTATVLWVVLRGLHDLGLIAVTGDKLREVVTLTASGSALVNEAPPA